MAKRKVQKELQEEQKCEHTVEGLACGRKVHSLGLCQAHYMRLYRTGECGSLHVGVDRVKRRLTPKDKGFIVAAVDRKLLTVPQLAERFGVAERTINRVCRDMKTFDEES